jgi:predicted amidohydrolase YtcJ
MAAAPPGAIVVDLGGRVLLPGFNDAHGHRIVSRWLIDVESAEAAIADTLAGGWTSISELFIDPRQIDELRDLDERGRLPLRVNVYLPVDARRGSEIWRDDYGPNQAISPNVRIGGIKAFADPYGPEAWLLTDPHVGQPAYFGGAQWEQEAFDDLIRTLHDDGWQVATHACGDAAQDLVLNAYEAALGGADNDIHRHRIEHAFMIRDDQVERMRDLAIIASIQLPLLFADRAADLESTLGRERLPWVGRWRDLLEADVPVVGGTDFPWAIHPGIPGKSSRAMRVLWDGATRLGIEPGPAPPWMTDQTITVEQGLDLITRMGAYATFEEDRKGTITVGKLADLVILRDDPRSVPIEDLPAVEVDMTMIGGRVEYGAI